jgi:2-polyprenyl-3-methyl-5-hydroxy-6-metoxy-1,4-benzoquinol methylase
MTNSITQERWQQAQSGELNQYQYDKEGDYKHAVYVILRDHFSINPETDLKDKKVLESGGGCYPSSYFCSDLKKAVNVEPLYENFPEAVKQKLSDKGVECVAVAFEDYKSRIKFDEIWFFNVLTHVKDPTLQLENAKKMTKTIRVFEPLDTPINNEHPHTLTYDFFVEQFPDTEIKVYSGGSVPKFHQASCAYFTWTKS